MTIRSVHALSAMALIIMACGSETSPSETEAIDRAVFIQTYVDLRVAAFKNQSQRVTDEDRAEVLERNGVTVEDLGRFVEVHGRDVEFMRDVWNEVEALLGEPQPTG